MKLLRKILVPIVPIYYLITWCRNLFYDWGVFKSKIYEHPIICVGNLSTGGTGKSPMIEFLIRMLEDRCAVATLSRGYKRETSGFRLAGDQDSALTLGDEPFQFYTKFKDTVQVSVDSDRQNGISNLLKLPNKPDVILLDDAFQHRKVTAGFNILLTTYDALYSDDWVLPTGNLREPKQGAKRAQVIIVTKCPVALTNTDKAAVLAKLKPQKNQDVFFSSIKYSETVYAHQSEMLVKELPAFTLVTGIANADPLVSYLKDEKLEFDHLNYPDHHVFSDADIALLSEKDLLITTEKDFMRLKTFDSLQSKLFYLPIKAALDSADFFEKRVLKYIESAK
ncbi:tetraacyldisaccharide 4'-kinase [Bizionia sp. KMM 8389]